MHVEEEVSVSVSQVNSSSETVVTTGFSTRMVSHKFGDLLAHHGPSDISDTSDDVVFEIVFENCIGGSAGGWMGRVSRSNAERIDLEVIKNFLFYSHTSKGHVSSGHTFSESVNIG